MTAYTQVAEEARRLLRGFSAVETLAKAFDEAGALEQAIADNAKAVASARADLALVQNDVANQKVMLDAIRSEAKRTTADAKTVADGIVAAAHAKAKAAILEAEASVLEVQELERTATSSARDTVVAATEQRDALLAEVVDLEKRAENARKYLAKLAA